MGGNGVCNLVSIICETSYHRVTASSMPSGAPFPADFGKSGIRPSMKGLSLTMPDMYRWATVLLVFHFLVSAALFSSLTSGAPTATSGTAHPSVQMAGPSTQSLQGMGLFNGAPGHGPLDVQPELPDPFAIHRSTTGATAARPPSPPTVCVNPSCLAADTLLRPPRA